MAAGHASRRLAAILAADVVGFSRLISADEEGTIKRLSELRDTVIDPIADAHHGRIFKTTGDGVLAEFSSVVDALRCAVEIQQKLAVNNAELPERSRMLFRIGINLGDIIVQGEDILGDGVNIAARLEGLAKPGGVCISGKVHDEVRGKTDIAFEFAGEQTVKNIETPIPVYNVIADSASSGQSDIRTPARPGKMWIAIAAFVLVGVLMAGGVALWQSISPSAQMEPATVALSDQQSIAVLPFQNFSGEVEQSYFADGIAEDIITDLSKISGLFVIARNSSFQYRDTSVDVAKVGRELGVKFILEGSVRRADNAVRINAQLIDVESGGHVWAERYDGSIADVFAVQDQVTGQIIQALKVHLTADEQDAVAVRGTRNADAYDAYLRGRKLLSERRIIDVDGYEEAKRHFNQAIALDPNYALAIAGLAWTNWLHAQASTLNLNAVAFELAEKSIALSDNALARRLLANRHFSLLAFYNETTRDMDQAVAELERARQLQPNDPDVLADLALALSFAGRPEEALQLAEQAQALNPNHPKWYFGASGIALLLSDQPERAVRHLQFWSDDNPSWFLPHLFLASALGNAGETADARDALERAYKQRHYEIMLPAVRRGWPMEADQEKIFIGGLRAAGARETRND